FDAIRADMTKASTEQQQELQNRLTFFGRFKNEVTDAVRSLFGIQTPTEKIAEDMHRLGEVLPIEQAIKLNDVLAKLADAQQAIIRTSIPYAKESADLQRFVELHVALVKQIEAATAAQQRSLNAQETVELGGATTRGAGTDELAAIRQRFEAQRQLLNTTATGNIAATMEALRQG